MIEEPGETGMIPKEPGEETIGALFSRLIDDAERFVRAEVRLYRAQLFDRLKQARSVLLLGAIAFFLAQAAMIGLVVGLVMILRRPLGPIWATAVVIGSLLAISGILVRIAIVKIHRLTDIKDAP